MIFETESALQKAMQDEGVPECNWLHSSGSKMFKIDLTEVLGSGLSKNQLTDRRHDLYPVDKPTWQQMGKLA